MTKAIKYWFLAIIMALLGLAEAMSGFILWLGFPNGGSGGGRWGAGGFGDITFWGLSKHAWIDIHDWVAVALVVIVTIHVILHWKWLARMTRNLFRRGQRRLTPIPVNIED